MTSPDQQPAADASQVAARVVGKLRGAGFTAYLAGGCVRDLLLGTPPKDYDVATDATPDKVAGLFPGAHLVGAHFGVVIVRRHGHTIEVATFRQDGTYSDGRRPDSITFANAEEDAKRRDFTVNGLFLDLSDGPDGPAAAVGPGGANVIDYVGGRADLESKTLRAIGDPAARIREDALRLLRAVRFAASLGFEIDPATWDAVRENAPRIRGIAAERIRDEVSRILLHPSRVRGFDLLVGSGLMLEVWPEVLELQGCEQPPQWHPEGDVFVHTRLMLELLPETVSLPLVLSVLFHDIAKPATFRYDAEADRIRFDGHDKLGAEMTEQILARLRFPNQVVDDTVEAVANHMVFKDVQRMRTAKLKRFMARPTFPDELELHRVDCASSNGLLDNVVFLDQKAAEFAAEPIIPPPLVTGRDLIDLGHRPGPRFKEILSEIQNLQLENSLASREEALDYLKDHFPSPRDGAK